MGYGQEGIDDNSQDHNRVRRNLDADADDVVSNSLNVSGQRGSINCRVVVTMI